MIQLYRKGTSHIVRGITCEMCVVNEFSYESLLKAGWHLSPEKAAEENTKENIKVETKVVEVETKNEAKAAKIKVSEVPKITKE
jgi:hypothetical protein